MLFMKRKKEHASKAFQISMCVTLRAYRTKVTYITQHLALTQRAGDEEELEAFLSVSTKAMLAAFASIQGPGARGEDPDPPLVWVPRDGSEPGILAGAAETFAVAASRVVSPHTSRNPFGI